MFRIFTIMSFLFTFSLAISLKSFFNYDFDSSASYDESEVRALYFKNKCHTCHGEKGEKVVSGSRVIKDMSPQDIKAALINYANNLDGLTSAAAVQMSIYAKNLSHNEMNKIIAYLKGVDFANKSSFNEDLEESRKKTKDGIYIK